MIVHSADGHGGTSAIVCFVLNALPLLVLMHRRRRVMTDGDGDDRNHRRDRACERDIFKNVGITLGREKIVGCRCRRFPALKREPRARTRAASRR